MRPTCPRRPRRRACPDLSLVACAAWVTVSAGSPEIDGLALRYAVDHESITIGQQFRRITVAPRTRRTFQMTPRILATV